eukprot:1136257-Pelagomonas_calceolata.AAC.3
MISARFAVGHNVQGPAAAAAAAAAILNVVKDPQCETHGQASELAGLRVSSKAVIRFYTSNILQQCENMKKRARWAQGGSSLPHPQQLLAPPPNAELGILVDIFHN